jgi:hypothetical protein
MAADNHLLLEDGDYLLLEDGFYIILDEYAYVVSSVDADNTDIHGNVYDDVVDVVLDNVSNIGAAVVVDSAGITVTEGAITVTNAGAVVIIDGTSRMFRILTSGSLHVALAGWTSGNAVVGTQTATLTNLGALGVIKAHQSYIAYSNTNTYDRYVGNLHTTHAAPRYVATTSGGSPTDRVLGYVSRARMHAVLDGSTYETVTLTATSVDSAATDYYGYYHILSEEAL